MLVVLLLLLLLLVLQLLVLGVLFLVLLLSELLSELLLVIGIMTVFRILTEHNLRGPDTAIELAAPVVLFRLPALSCSQVRFNLEFALSAAAAVPSLHASDNSKTECLCYVRFGVASLFIPCEIALRAKKTSNFGGPYFHLHRVP